MHPLTTLVFPDTVVAPQTAAQLLMFFEKIYHYLPAEPPVSKKAGPPPAADPYAEAGLCLGYPPVPVGEGLERFWKTIRDLQGNVNDYGHRLPHLSLAAQNFQDSPDRDEKTVSALVGKLHAGQPDDKSAETGPDLEAELWKARIVLKLAEGFDAIEEEVEQGLAGLTDREQEMLSALKGQEEEEDTEILGAAGLGSIMPEKPSINTSRVKAWSRLFLAEQAAGKAPAEHWLAATANREALLLLVDAYTNRFKQEPVKLFTLPLAPLPKATEAMLAKRAAFRDAVAAPRLFLQTLLQGITLGAEPLPPDAAAGARLARAIAGWSQALGEHLGYAGLAAASLSFYCFPRLTSPALFDLAFPCPGISRPAASAEGCTVIALLETAT